MPNNPQPERREMKHDEPAFPTDSERQVGPDTWHFQGMTLLDYFAAAVAKSGHCPHNVYEHEKRAAWVWDEAEAMLAERERRMKEARNA